MATECRGWGWQYLCLCFENDDYSRMQAISLRAVNTKADPAG